MAAKATAKDSSVKLEMAYVGKRNHSHREQIRRISEAVRAENLSHSWAEPALMWFFWARLESMLYSKIQLGKADDHDEVRTITSLAIYRGLDCFCFCFCFDNVRYRSVNFIN